MTRLFMRDFAFTQAIKQTTNSFFVVPFRRNFPTSQ
jgi:hypothetical protein